MPDSKQSRSISIIIIGCGQRGRAYAYAAKCLAGRVEVVGVADTSSRIRNAFVQDYAPLVRPELIFSDWREVFQAPRKADAVAICVQDALHRDCAMSAAENGYHILCEKPLATSLKDCIDIIQAVKKANVIFGIGHVLRYNAHNAFIFDVLRKGLLGDILNINHTEPVGFWHFAHSFVRGNWAQEKTSTFSLMSKSCHDIDILHAYFACLSNAEIRRVTSFGGLTHFRKNRKPKTAAAAKKCVECAINKSCPYSAQRIYLEPFQKGYKEWPIDTVVQPTASVQDLEDTLARTNYGSCVYELSNDVADNQVVNLEFETEAGPATATFTMIATSKEQCERITRIYGSLGVLTSDSVGPIKVFDFVKNTETVFQIDTADTTSGHGGGDQGLFRNFVSAVEAVEHRKQDMPVAQQEYLAVTLNQVLQSHRTVFAAEYSRRSGGIPIEPINFDKSW